MVLVDLEVAVVVTEDMDMILFIAKVVKAMKGELVLVVSLVLGLVVAHAIAIIVKELDIQKLIAIRFT